MHPIPVVLRLLIAASLAVTAGAALAQAKDAPAPPKDRSHSAHGPAFDQGPRQVAWRMDGVGTAHFLVTTSKPEAQAFFDQGINLLHQQMTDCRHHWCRRKAREHWRLRARQAFAEGFWFELVAPALRWPGP